MTPEEKLKRIAKLISEEADLLITVELDNTEAHKAIKIYSAEGKHIGNGVIKVMDTRMTTQAPSLFSNSNVTYKAKINLRSLLDGGKSNIT